MTKDMIFLTTVLQRLASGLSALDTSEAPYWLQEDVAKLSVHAHEASDRAQAFARLEKEKVHE